MAGTVVRGAVLVVAVLALVVPGCGDDGSAGGSTDTAGSAATEPAPTTLTVATLNVLHGLPLPDSCGAETDFCQAPDRLDLLWQALEADAGCPDVIALEEVGPRQRELVPGRLADLCGGDHRILFHDVDNPDQEMILTTLGVVDERYVDLSGPPWTAQHARLDTALGLVDVFATHFASSAFNPDCSPAEASTTCGPECPDGIEMGSCNALETLTFLDERAGDAALQLVVGDLNDEIDDPRLALLTDAGFVDTWLVAGNPECGAGHPDACTSGVTGDSALDGLDEPEQDLDRRIDFVLARPADGCELAVDTPDDADGDGTATGLFAAGPLDPPVKGLAWFSDHQGVQADLGLTCRDGSGAA